jgi:hypothetical protein
MFKDIKDFPNNLNKSFYTSFLTKNTLYQGDCINILLQSEYIEKKISEIPVMIISNSCDNSLENQRHLNLNIIYAPVARISKIIDRLKLKGVEENIIKEVLSGFKWVKLLYIIL